MPRTWASTNLSDVEHRELVELSELSRYLHAHDSRAESAPPLEAPAINTDLRKFNATAVSRIREAIDRVRTHVSYRRLDNTAAYKAKILAQYFPRTHHVLVKRSDKPAMPLWVYEIGSPLEAAHLYAAHFTRTDYMRDMTYNRAIVFVIACHIINEPWVLGFLADLESMLRSGAARHQLERLAESADVARAL